MTFPPDLDAERGSGGRPPTKELCEMKEVSFFIGIDANGDFATAIDNSGCWENYADEIGGDGIVKIIQVKLNVDLTPTVVQATFNDGSSVVNAEVK